MNPRYGSRIGTFGTESAVRKTCLLVNSSRYDRSAFVFHTPFHLRQFLRVYNHPVAFQYLRTAVWNDDLAAPLYHHNDRILIEARLRDLLYHTSGDLVSSESLLKGFPGCP